VIDSGRQNKALQQNRGDVLRYGESIGCDLLKAAVPSVLCPYESRQVPLFRDRAASTLLAIEIEMVAGLRFAAMGRMASLP